jgi:hypothetical protein
MNCFGSPPLATSLFVEVWEKEKQYFVKILYNGIYSKIWCQGKEEIECPYLDWKTQV